MCGICFILNIPIKNHKFNFNFFNSYNPNSSQKPLPFNQHIIQNKLILSNHFIPSHICKLIGNRGPDHIVINQIDMNKITYNQHKNNYLEDQKEYQVLQGKAVGIQSTLHLRGDKIYQPNVQGSYFLYNGQIWNTGILQPIKQGQNDAEWLHRILHKCYGDQQKILQTLRQIRGDFAIILVQKEKIFIMKDYFGKRSLLIGMSQDHLIISSAPIENEKIIEQKQDMNINPNNEDEQKQTSWKQKYEAQWLSSKNKRFFQVPNNSLISIKLNKNEAVWEHFNIEKVSLLRMIQKNQNQNQEQIMMKCKQLLIDSVKELTECIKDVQKQQNNQNKNPKLAVLFSGGVDSTLIARILDLVLPKDQQIDLINLAFRQDAPDRESGRISYEQLKQLSPDRKFNLILLDKTLNDIEPIKKELTELIYPKTTHMDFNIASALHVASKQTKAKIILTGLGADEIFSGYSRYRIAFKRAGYEETENQMLFDMQRLWIRNLGRDDRAIAVNGKQVRYPFLYLPLWRYLRTVELNKLTEGTGEKIMLRKIARQFRLQKASTFKKKAIQFGTRLAKLSNVKCFGSNRKAKGTFQYK